MLLKAYFAVLLSLTSVIGAVATSMVDPHLQLLAIKQHFRNAGIVPYLINDFDPAVTMDAFFYTVGDITAGELLTVLRAQPIFQYLHALYLYCLQKPNQLHPFPSTFLIQQ